jgi:cell division protein FtsA
VTMDIARGLTMRLADAERLKILQGSCLAHTQDENQTLMVDRLLDQSSPLASLTKAQLVRVIKPRVDEILELVRDRLKASGFSAHAGRRLVLTGGACQLHGMVETARHILSPHVRIGRPDKVQGLPPSAQNPAFAVVAGLALYPQMAKRERFAPHRQTFMQLDSEDGYMARVGRWLKESF